MNFIPRVSEVQATPVDHDGAALMVVSVGNQAHCIDRGAFELLFHAAEDPVAGCAGGTPVERLLRAKVERPGPPAGNGHSGGRKAKHTPPPRKTAGPAKAGDALDLTGYPSELQDPRSERARAIWDRLKKAPADLSTLAEQTDDGSDDAISRTSAALYAMRRKGLVEKDGEPGSPWNIV